MENRRCVIIGASPDADIELVRNSIIKTDFVVCADGGHVTAKRAGIVPGLIAGDFDSSEMPDDPGCELIKLPVRKDDTDTMFLVRECLKRGYNDFLLLGATGGRPDHTAANICTLEYIRQNGAIGIIEDSRYTIQIMGPGEHLILEMNDCGFSAFPYACEKCTLSLRGFDYELEKGSLTSDYVLGVSNRICSDRAVVSVHDGLLLVYILKKGCFD